MKRLLIFVVLVVVAVCGVAVIRALGVPAPPSAARGAPAATAPITVDSVVAANRLAGAIRFRTVSNASGAPIDTAQYRGLHDYFVKAFPLVHKTLKRDTVGTLSLLYEWTGRNPALPPVVLMGHFDVVPVPDANLKEWQHGPFSGDVADGFIWGRGALDDKTTVLTILEAAEALLASGYAPPRTIYFAFGHDEEVGGRYGARKIVERLVARGVKPALVLDEGGFVATGLVPGSDRPVALVGIAEKGYVSLKLTARANGGHSSSPPARTAIGALARAIAALEANPFPTSLDGVMRETLVEAAPYVPFTAKLVLANLWLTGPLVRRAIERSPLAAAFVHTTTAPTVIAGGVKDNVLPPEATAIVNFRIKPGETVASVEARVRAVVADTGVTVAQMDSVAMDPSPVSDPRSGAFAAIRAAVRASAPDPNTPVVPYLVPGGTDAKYWSAHSDRAYRFLPIPMTMADVPRVHGVNERVGVAGYAASVNFFAALLRGLDGLDATPAR